MPTKSEMEMVLPMIKTDNDDIRQKLKDLKPIENLDIEDFAKHLASKRNNPAEYSGIIIGFFKRWKLERETKAVGLLNDYLEKMRLASNSAAQLQETILKNRIMFIFQVQFAQERLQRQWAEEKKGFLEREVLADLRIAKARAFTKFYKTVDLSNLSESALILLNMTTERSSSSSYSSLTSSASSSVQYGSPEDIMRIKREEKQMEIVMQELLSNIKLKNAQTEIITEQANQEKTKTEHQKWKNERERNRPK